MCDQNESGFTPHYTFNEKIYFDFNLVLGGVPWEESCWEEFRGIASGGKYIF